MVRGGRLFRVDVDTGAAEEPIIATRVTAVDVDAKDRPAMVAAGHLVLRGVALDVGVRPGLDELLRVSPDGRHAVVRRERGLKLVTPAPRGAPRVLPLAGSTAVFVRGGLVVDNAGELELLDPASGKELAAWMAPPESSLIGADGDDALVVSEGRVLVVPVRR